MLTITIYNILIVIVLFFISSIIIYSNYKLKIKTIKYKTNINVLKMSIEELKQEYSVLDTTHSKTIETLNKTVYQKKSSEVRLGKIGENLAPFTNGWPWDPNNFRFIGSPVDGIQFTEDMLYFVEIKTGKSRLSKYQIKCRDLVQKGKVMFVTYRIGENGIEIKKFPNEIN